MYNCALPDGPQPPRTERPTDAQVLQRAHAREHPQRALAQEIRVVRRPPHLAAISIALIMLLLLLLLLLLRLLLLLLLHAGDVLDNFLDFAGGQAAERLVQSRGVQLDYLFVDVRMYVGTYECMNA